ncbi:tRNA dihydrouridine synthase DusB [Hyphobacterium marinum]|uniref:tRNA-dihydrouridine synthase n=1 Tax=Hyphobacterium marinum TaxID=3116574 RepID=A0ABU7LYH4_9PROT|nr:tRNA dihydrouridine synthase DusB [Hyphobacterium sp. Y6023]MEE2566585.1 tRNA dihydrouridine synthase DusB [Hyphobacterium sp. Y6023]
MTIQIGPHTIDARAVLAPMSGVTDLPFRRQARRFGAGYVVSEMVASEALAEGREDVLRKTARDEAGGPHIVQLAGREAKWMALGAGIAAGEGADIIDINMGCPAKQVTRGLSGSALMRDLDHAMTLIEAVLGATDRPVTLKMRLGWDDRSINAPELARRAEAAGVQLVTVHGRTRCQFYKGQADWRAVRAVREAISIPLVVNGDITDAQSARTALEQSGADLVMIGRASQGLPWLVGEIDAALKGEVRKTALADKLDGLKAQLADSIALYGDHIGLRMMRKHFASFIDALPGDGVVALKARLCREPDPVTVERALSEIVEDMGAEAA